MIVTGAFLADHAESRENKLYVEGGAWRSADIPNTRVPTLVLLLDSGPDDSGTTFKLVIEMTSPDGADRVIAEGDMVVTDRAAFGVIPNFQFPLNAGSGRYGFRCRIDGRQEMPAAFGLDVTVDEDWLRQNQ
ncbi:hypothetical protein I0Q12_19490 [Rhodococcus sp. CX]|uniref:DUF6941 family protein n=1 Tax=Rhodococcus sp. CX TaxID=2789880 RepID=UPI0018CF4160|nr:hypothetical protein [Rhodococcus sp. CX]MBH0121575.1 hypothetical protein [Rhodococcus sp. CX]